MDFASQRQAWDEDGYFILRGFAEPDIGQEMEREVVHAIRTDPPSAHPGMLGQGYESHSSLVIQPEGKPRTDAAEPEDLISKVFNPHLLGASAAFAKRKDIGDIVANLIGPEVDVFQSQFIFKNPGAWGQPWHQDSYYFHFRSQPQVGVWLAISEATLENGCLSVLPGSHRPMKIYDHHPDLREGSNLGYLEIKDQNTANAIPVLMQPGDMLVFHSYLLHKSEDNRSKNRRSAMVYHYSIADNECIDADWEMRTRRVRHPVPVRRAA